MSNTKVICDYCNEPAELVTGNIIYPRRADLRKLQFWRCFPCKARVGCHKRSDAKPLGRLANKSLRKAKSAAHSAFDPIWKSGDVKRRAAYEWLASRLGIEASDCHIGFFDEDMCQKVIDICSDLNKELELLDKL